jgi:ectoine hydroxylase-related dioxygenase (phytanoyl-CoA dioxygenase family)
MQQYPITEDQVAFYQENGFIRLENVLSPDEVRRVRDAVDRAAEDVKQKQLNLGPRSDPGYAKVFLQMVNLWERYPFFEEYAHTVKIGEIARRLTRSRAVRLWHDQALVKYPKDSKETAWHQDKVYWPMEQAGALSCWMALDDVSVANGCMSFIPRSHKLGPLEAVDLGNAAPGSILDVLPPAARIPPVTAEMPAGSCTFHDGLTLHYAGANTTEKPRRAMVTIYIPAGITYKSHPHLVGDRSNLQPGEEFHGPLFPVIARE